jgi:hypothetical protein
MAAGFVLYHELVHVTSTAGDGYGNYSKSAGVNLAANEPDIARLQANNYMLYAMQNSMTPYEYAQATTSWGTSVFEIGCEDTYSNCHDLVKDAGCCDTRTSAGNLNDGRCCASCAVMNATEKCMSSMQAPVCINVYSNCDDFKSYCGNPNIKFSDGSTVVETCCLTCQ